MKANVLVGSPDETVRNRLQALLAKDGFRVTVAEDGVKALGSVQNSPPEMVFCARQMGAVSGAQVKSQCKEMDPDIKFAYLDDAPGEGNLSPSASDEEVLKTANCFLRELRGKILVVDDHEDLRQTVVQFLQTAGFEVEEAADGQEAVEKVARTHYDVVLTDIHMPRMDGIQAAGKIHQMRPSSYVVVMTGEADEEEVEQALKAARGHYACLRKPFEYNSFVICVRNLRKEARDYRQQVERSAILKAQDSLKSNVGAAIHRFEVAKGKVALWGFIVLFAASVGLVFGWASSAIPNFVKALSQKAEQVEKQIDRIEEKESELRRTLEKGPP